VKVDTDTETRPEAAERQPEILAKFGLLQLVACLGTAFAVVIAIILFD
jgi:hypothetical protein